MENPMKMDDLGVPLFSETLVYSYTLNNQEPFFIVLFFSPLRDAMLRTIAPSSQSLGRDVFLENTGGDAKKL